MNVVQDLFYVLAAIVLGALGGMFIAYVATAVSGLQP